MYKMDKSSIRGTALTWFRNYVTNRQQAVRVSKENSKDYILSHYNTITTGVSQGSTLGPILFIIYFATYRNSYISYTEDTTLIIRNKSFGGLLINAYDDLCSLVD